ncbi:hypothetical protein [Mycolicibacterium sediminis]|nr:hypothetical protein [Mycolicibacterium sediminis]
MTACGSTPPSLPTDTSPAGVHKLLTGTAGQDFIDSVATYDWPDDGAEAAAVFDWIARDAASTDATTATRAGQTAQAIANYLSTRGDELLELSSGWFGLSHQTVGSRNPELARSFTESLLPFLKPLVCDSNGTLGFDLLDPAGCDASVQAAKPMFAVLNTDERSGRTLTGAASTDVDRWVQSYADGAPTSGADLAFAGRLLGLASLGAQRSGAPVRSLHDEVQQAQYVIATAAIARKQAAMWPEFMVEGRLMSPEEVRTKLGVTRVDEYYGALDNLVLAVGAHRAIRDQLRGEYEKVTGHQ